MIVYSLLIILFCLEINCHDFDGVEYATKPGIPSVCSPVDGGFLTGRQMVLTVYNASDMIGRALTYDFEIYSDDTLTFKLVQGNDIPEGLGGTTSWIIPPRLAANQIYWWRTRACFEEVCGDWMSPVSFNLVDQAIPGLVYPLGHSVCPENSELVIRNVPDNLDMTITYDFEIFSDEAQTTVIWSRSNVPQNNSGFTAVIIDIQLPDHRYLWWRARAVQGKMKGPWSGSVSFFVEALDQVTPVSPVNGFVSLYTSPELIIENIEQRCGYTVSYDFEVYDDASLTNRIDCCFEVLEGEFELTSWTVSIPLEDEASYWWRSRACSQEFCGDWSNIQSFEIDLSKTPGSVYADDIVHCGVTCPDAVIYRDCNEALGPPDFWYEDNPNSHDGRTYHGFVSLGIRGSMIVDMGEGSEIVDEEGADLLIWQAVATEEFQVFVAEHAGGPYIDLGFAGTGWFDDEESWSKRSNESYCYHNPNSACYTTPYSRGGEVAWCDVSSSDMDRVRFVRIVDQQPWGDLRKDCYYLDPETGEWVPYLHAGADIDAVKARHTETDDD